MENEEKIKLHKKRIIHHIYREFAKKEINLISNSFTYVQNILIELFTSYLSDLAINENIDIKNIAILRITQDYADRSFELDIITNSMR